MIIVDTGAWLALIDRRDAYHNRCCDFFRHNHEALMTTWPVLVECVHLMFGRIGVAKTLSWMQTLEAQGVGIFVMQASHFTRLNTLMHQFRDLPMDLADASLVLLAEESGEGRIVSTDERDFHTYRWKNQHPFRNLLLAHS
ncbi:type II toxin-antitoxin system VapC family toxin [Desulfonatronovibrio magnus]|uniref:type II toxin-antitoxin system VapC family toxin n=1 Tax=Desulfonatronovibrio magnus TaxID=698827 RepID=UPI0005EBA2FE|nr:PIN domain-containing protein [Desulfonatronovibrio magnus]